MLSNAKNRPTRLGGTVPRLIVGDRPPLAQSSHATSHISPQGVRQFRPPPSQAYTTLRSKDQTLFSR